MATIPNYLIIANNALWIIIETEGRYFYMRLFHQVKSFGRWTDRTATSRT